MFYNMSFFPRGLSSADAKSICTLPGEFCFTGQVRKMQRGGGLFCVSPALDVSREGVDHVFLSPPLSFLCPHHYGVEARKPHSQWKHA